MAKFCSECGESTTELMRRCPRCGAELMCSSKRSGSMVRFAIIGIGVAIIISTFLNWYSLHLRIDGGMLDAVVGSLSRLFSGYSGISTTYGLVAFGMALAMIIFAVCRSKILTVVAAVGCVVVGMLALLSPPELSDLMQTTTSEGDKVMDLFEGPMTGLSPMDTLTTAFDVIKSCTAVEVLHGVKIMVILAYAAAALSIYDVARSYVRRK